MASTTTSERHSPVTALTSIFTPPSFCGNYVDYDLWSSSSSAPGVLSCLPGDIDPRGWYMSSYYSPAICPSGYSANCTRYDTDLGLPVLADETAVICCPHSFKCAVNEYAGCVSGGSGSTTTALYVQVRWQESDLSIFETSPLTTGLPKRNRHLGWDPESSLTSVFIFPSDCASGTDMWETRETCEPLTGDYYSPAICPSGWIAAVTRPVLGNHGPPEEPEETAMICCPRGMTIDFEVCGARYCFSSALSTGSSGVSIDLLKLRGGIQIRWASSDLSVLETHPLTSGLILNTQMPKLEVIAPLTSEYRLSVGLAFIPLVLTIISAICGFGLLFKKRRSEKSRGTQSSLSTKTHFKPSMLSWPCMILLLGLTMSVLALIEISCHALPTTSGPVHISNLNITKVYVSDVTVTGSGIFDLTMTSQQVACSTFGNYTISPLVTENHGTPITTEITKAAGWEYTLESACSIASIPINFPQCEPPSGAPPSEKWLPEDGGFEEGRSIVGEYFLATILPTLLGTMFAIPWKIIHLHIASLEPFRQMARPKGALASTSLFRNYGGLGAVMRPFPAITLCLVYLSALVAPLSTEAWSLRLFGTCRDHEHVGCLPILLAVPQVVRTIEATLALMLLLTIALAVGLISWSTGVIADPRSILGIASLSHSPELQRIMDVVSRAELNSPIREVKRRFTDLTLHLGILNSVSGNSEYGITVLNQSLSSGNNVDDYQHPKPTTQISRPVPIARIVTRLAAFSIFLVALSALIIYYKLTGSDTAFERFMSSESFGPRFLFSLCGVIISFGLGSVYQSVVLFAPYINLSYGRITASSSILLPYTADPYSNLLPSLRRGNYFLATIGVLTILSDFLPLLLANVPFNRTTMWKAHLICSWLSVGILLLMVGILLALVLLLVLRRPRKNFINEEVLRGSPIGAALFVLCESGSNNVMQYFDGISALSTGERNKRVLNLPLHYCLEQSGDQISGYHMRITAVSSSS